MRNLLLFSMLFILHTLSGQTPDIEPNFRVRHYTVENGLSNDWISDIDQDTDGYIWVATQYGLNRFDGEKFTTYTYHPDNEEGLKGNWVRRISQKQDGNYYLGTLGAGYNLFNRDHNHFRRGLEDSLIVRSVINDIIHTADGDTWLATSEGVFILDQQQKLKKRIDRYTRVATMGHNDELILVGNPQGLWIYDLAGELKSHVFQERPVAAVKSIDENRIILVSQKQLFELRQSPNGVWEERNLNVSVRENVQSLFGPLIYIDNHDQIWIQSEGGLLCCSNDLQKQSFFHPRKLLGDLVTPGLSIHVIFQDYEDTYWIGTSQGLFQLIPSKPFLHPFLQKQGLLLPNTRAITAVDQNYLFGTNKGLVSWNGRDTSLLITGTVTSLFTASTGKSYCVVKKNQRQQFWEINVKTKRAKKLDCPSIDTTNVTSWAITEDQRSRIWIAQWQYLVCYDPADQTSFKVELKNNLDQVLKLNAIDLEVDQKDGLWIATLSEGLVSVPNLSLVEVGSIDQFQQYKHDFSDPNTISSDIVQTIFLSKDSSVWIGTDGGLNRLKPQKGVIQRWLRSEKMLDDKILGITEDSSGRLWLSTIGHGILSFNPKEEQFNQYTRQDGLIDNAMLLSSVYQNADGRIWMGSGSGLHAFFPNEIYSDSVRSMSLKFQELIRYQSDTTIKESFPVLGKQKSAPLVISPKDQAMRLEFSLLSFLNPDQHRYQFFLKGYHDTWLPEQETGQLLLTKLPPGDYLLESKAYSLNRELQADYPPIYIRVVPPWYQSTLAWVIYTLLFLTLIFGIYQLQLRRKLSKAEEVRTKEMMATKMRWFHQIAHEFRTPLTLIFGAIDRLKSTTNQQQLNDSAIDQVETQANYLTLQIDGILDLARAQSGQPILEPTLGEFISYQRYLLHSFSSLAETQQVQLKFKTNRSQLFFQFDEEAWRKIITNLLSNALKFMPSGGTLSLEIKVSDQDDFYLFVKDTGPGISKAMIGKIFTPFIQADSSPEKGTGVGLALVKTLVELQGGIISGESKLGKGATFIIHQKLPQTETISGPSVEPKQELSNEAKTILVAEDHPEICDYLSFCLSDQYHVVIKHNGDDAWAFCQEFLPDLIISDIMMPGYSGFELSRLIRANKNTDHIPLILLTAKSGQESRMKGLEMGADEFLTKPFHRKELRLKIDRLLQVQQRLQEKYNSGNFSVETSTAITDTFMQRVVEQIEAELENEKYSVQDLADHLHLSRVHLFRKIKSLTGQSPTIFIRQIRLQKAYERLTQTDLTVAEIAYQVGFKDPAYFSKVFLEQYGYRPSERRNNH